MAVMEEFLCGCMENGDGNEFLSPCSCLIGTALQNAGPRIFTGHRPVLLMLNQQYQNTDNPLNITMKHFFIIYLLICLSELLLHLLNS